MCARVEAVTPGPVPGTEALQPRLVWRPGELVHSEADIVLGPEQGQPLIRPGVTGPGLGEAEVRTQAGEVKQPRVEAGPPPEHSQAERQQEQAEERLNHYRVFEHDQSQRLN